MTISALASDDPRTAEIKVAGPAALLVAKLHKLGERQDQPDRLIDKDAHDIYRLLVATDTQALSQTRTGLQNDELAGDATNQAIIYLQQLFAPGSEALGSMMAGRASRQSSQGKKRYQGSNVAPGVREALSAARVSTR